MLKGIDTSMVFQGPDLTVDMVRAEGADFHITQVTQGAYWFRRGSLKRIRQTQKAGMIAGAYHFLTRIDEPGTDTEVAWNSGTEQARFFIKHLPIVNGKPSADGLLIGVDVENVHPTEVVRNGVSYHQNPNGPSWRTVKDFVAEWFRTFPDHPLFVYSSWHEWFHGGQDVRKLNKNVHCWNADWVTAGHGRKLGRHWDDAAIAEFRAHAALAGPDVPRWGGFGRARLWQCAGFGIEGYGKVDGNLFDGTLDELRAFTVDRLDDGDAPAPPAAGPLLPVPIGTAVSLAGATLTAVYQLPAGAHRVATYEVELATLGADGTWPAASLWHGSAVMNALQAANTDASLETDTIGPADGLAVLDIDSRPSRWGMRIKNPRPRVRLRASARIASYDWQLTQHGRVLDHGEAATAGLGADRLTIDLTPSVDLCPAGDPPKGYYFPPLDHTRKGYWGFTYRVGGRTHSEYSVDINRGSGATDEGDPVLAAAPGTVHSVDLASGTVTLKHWDGKHFTEYRHMRDIPARIRAKADPRFQETVRVDLLEVVGHISDKEAEGQYHLHHVHFRGLDGNGEPKRVQMSFGGVPFPVSLATGDFPPGDGDWTSKRVPIRPWKKASPVRLQITVNWEDPVAGATLVSKRQLRFSVGKPDLQRDVPVPKTHSRAGQSGLVRLDHPYDGPALAPGTYAIRWRCTDDAGSATDWVIDRAVIVTG